MNSVSPVLTEAEVPSEQVIAFGQEEYYPVIAARIRYAGDSLGSVVRYRFTDKEREVVASGFDLLLSQPHHGQLMPIAIQFAKPESYPEAE